MNNQLTIYNFGDTEIEAVEAQGGIALSDEQIGVALGYAEPGKSIRKIVERDLAGNNELTGLAVSVKLTRTDGKVYNTRVWGEQGVMAITFLAKTKKAAAFRKWARETLFAMRQGIHPNHQEAAQAMSQIMQVIGTLVQQTTTVVAETQALTNAFIDLRDAHDALERKVTEKPAPKPVPKPGPTFTLPEVPKGRAAGHYMAHELIDQAEAKAPDITLEGSPIAAIRQKMGLSQARFALLVDLGLEAVQNAEKGRTKRIHPKYWKEGVSRLGYDFEAVAALYAKWQDDRRNLLLGRQRHGIVSFPPGNARRPTAR